MDNSLFIDDFINTLTKIQENEFKIHNFTYTEVDLPKKIVNDNLMDFRNFKTTLIKRSIKDKSKPSFINKKEIEVDNNINILEDDIFQFNEEIQESNKLDIENITIEDKKKLINEYLSRKSILLEENQINKINQLLEDPEFNFKKYITISKIQHQITKIGFLKKMEDGSYLFDFKEKQKNKNIFFK
jgi:hypothetical protein